MQFPRRLTALRRPLALRRQFSDKPSSSSDKPSASSDTLSVSSDTLSVSSDTSSVPEKYEPKNVTKDDLRWRTPWHQKNSDYYSFLRTFYTEKNNTHVLKMLHSPIDLSPTSVKRWWAGKVEEQDIAEQRFIPERNQILGNELAAAHFIVHRGGAIKFYGDDNWIKADEKQNYSLPRFYNDTKILEAIDCSDMNIRYEGLLNLRDLHEVRWLSLNDCKYIDDWCLDKISNIFSHSLVYLDLRNCRGVTANGLGALYRMPHLKILYLDDFWKSTIYEMTCLLLEEANPELDIRSDPVTFEVSTAP